jgi:hypothetical protein
MKDRPGKLPWIFWLLLAVLALLAPSLWLAAVDSAAEPMTGRWMIDFERPDGNVLLTTHRRSSSGHGEWTSSSSYSKAEFRALVRPAGPSETPARFELVRDAGTIAFEGRLDSSGGQGRFTFQADPRFVAEMGRLGYSPLSSDRLWTMLIHDISRSFVRDLAAGGYEHIGLEDLVAMRIHGAGPEFVKELKALGYERLPVHDLIAMRIHGATASFLRELKSLGYERLSADDLVALRIHGATPAFIREIAGLGYTRLPAEQLVQLRIHGVTPQYIRELMDLGYRHLAADDLVNMKIHGVTVDYVKKVKARQSDVTADELVEGKVRGER